MSLLINNAPEIPAETIRIVKTVFPKGNIYTRMSDIIGPIFDDDMFISIFSSLGQHAISAWRLALVTVMQFIEGLSDRQAAEAVRARIDWKYALALELDDTGFDSSVLCEFRARLISGGLEQSLLDAVLVRFKELGLLKARGKQRTDSTHIISAARSLSRIELVGETMRAALNSIAEAEPDWLVSRVPLDWFDRYGARVEQYRFPKDEDKRRALADQIGQDGHLLLSHVYGAHDMRHIRDIPAIEILRLVWVHQFHVVDDIACMRSVDNTSSSSTKIDSPYDIDARYSIKRETKWSGYKSHITETCDKDGPSFIINVETTIATTPDNAMTTEIHNHLADHNLLPSEHIVDTGYVDAELIVNSRHKHNIDLVGPVQTDTSWQAKEGQGFDTSSFLINWEEKTTTCPRGITTSNWQREKDRFGNDHVCMKFSTQSCRECPCRSRCTRSKDRPREISVRNKEEYDVLQERRRDQSTKDWKSRYNLRSGIEGTISQAVRMCDLRQSRYIGLAKTHLQNVITAIALNMTRFDAWLTGQPRAKTRRSTFAMLHPSPA